MRMSGNSFSNISGAFQGAAAGLSQAADVKSREALEQMRDARAENLARLQFQWKAQHDVNMADRSEAHDERLQGKSLAVQQQISERSAQIQAQGNVDYMGRMTAAQENFLERQRAEQSGREKVESMREIMRNRLEAQNAVAEIDRRKFALQKEIDSATKSNLQISLEQDPTKKAQLQAADPTIGKLLDQQQQLDAERAQTFRRYAVYGESLGDPTFKGVSTQNLPGPNTPGAPAAPGTTDTTGGAPARTDNPLDKNAPSYTSDADNQPAIMPGASGGAGASGSSPLSSGAPAGGRPIFTGLAPAPTRTPMGPLVSPPTIMPQPASPSSGGPGGTPAGGMPSMNFGSTAQSSTPQLIPSGT